MITAEQFAEWKEQEVTKEIFGLLKEMKEDLQKRMSNGYTISSKAEKTHGMTNKTVGQIEGLNQLLNISYNDDDEVADVSDVTGH